MFYVSDTQNFDCFGLSSPIVAAVTAQGYTTPTPIQFGAIPALLEGRDLMGIAQTGTGKTAAFLLPLLHALSENRDRVERFHTRALILAPTRELAVQIEEHAKMLGAGLRLRTSIVLGGMSRASQVRRMSAGADIVIGTPGRLLDLISAGQLKLDRTSHLVLDEVDRMLDMGFIIDVRKILARIPERRQTAMFSATMVPEIDALARGFLHDPVMVRVAPEVRAPAKIEQSVFFASAGDKRFLLRDLLSDHAVTRAIVFTRTKRGADKVAEHLGHDGVNAETMHGNMRQGARQAALESFRSGVARVLVATDLAGRGIDVPGVSHVVNYDLPMTPEDYVHRIGRTARAGLEGIAISYCEASERHLLRAIERHIKAKLNVAGGHDPRPDSDMPDRTGKQNAAGKRFGNAPKRFGSSPFGGAPRQDRGPRPEFSRERQPSRGGEVEARHDVPRFEELAPLPTHHEAPRVVREERVFAEKPRAPRREHAFNDGAPRDAGDGVSRKREAGGFAGGERPRDERPRGDSPRESRPQGDRPQGERPRGDRPFVARPRDDRPQGDRPHGDRPHGDRVNSDRTNGDRPHGDRPHGERRVHHDGAPGGKPAGGKPAYAKPGFGKPAYAKSGKPGGGAGRPHAGKPGGAKPAGSAKPVWAAKKPHRKGQAGGGRSAA